MLLVCPNLRQSFIVIGKPKTIDMYPTSWKQQFIGQISVANNIYSYKKKRIKFQLLEYEYMIVV